MLAPKDQKPTGRVRMDSWLTEVEKKSFVADPTGLLEIYKSTEKWLKSDGWAPPPPGVAYRPRHGVVWRKGHVASLDLHRNGISGQMPPIRLPHLLSLIMFGNRLSGPLLDLPRTLVHLDLSKNELNGPLPSVGRLTRLQRLHVEKNEFEGELAKDWPSTLEIFTANDNHFEGEVPTFEGTSLTTVWLHNNNLYGRVDIKANVETLLIPRTCVTEMHVANLQLI